VRPERAVSVDGFDLYPADTPTAAGVSIGLSPLLRTRLLWPAWAGCITDLLLLCSARLILAPGQGSTGGKHWEATGPGCITDLLLLSSALCQGSTGGKPRPGGGDRGRTLWATVPTES
jgi:hypothetical protein